MNYGLLLKTPPDLATFALVSLDEAKLHVKADDLTADDTLISTLIDAAIGEVEGYLRGAIAQQQWTLTLDRFPSAHGVAVGVSSALGGSFEPSGGYGYGSSSMNHDSNHHRPWTYEIRLPKPPLISVDAIRYVAVDGTQTVLAADQYLADKTSLPARIQPAYGVPWPITRIVPRAVEVDFTCGYASANDLLPSDKAALVAATLLRVGDLYRNREAQIVAATITDNPAACRLLDRMKYREFA